MAPKSVAWASPQLASISESFLVQVAMKKPLWLLRMAVASAKLGLMAQIWKCCIELKEMSRREWGLSNALVHAFMGWEMKAYELRCQEVSLQIELAKGKLKKKCSRVSKGP